MRLVKGRERIIVSPVVHEQSEIRECKEAGYSDGLGH